MSIKNQKNVIVVASVVAALFAGTVLLGGYAKSVPAKSESGSQSQIKACCPMLGAQVVQDGEVSCPDLAKAAFNAEACPMGRTEPCCEVNPPKDCCGKPCPPDCPKPCCAKEGAASGCGASVDAAGGCSAAADAVAQ